MSLTADDKKDLAKLLKEQKPAIIDGNITEWLFRALIALLLFMGNNMRLEQQSQGKALQDLKQDISEMKTKNEFYNKDIEGFRAVLAKPRFTKEDFDSHINPILSQLNATTNETNNHSTELQSIKQRINKLEYQIIELIDVKKN